MAVGCWCLHWQVRGDWWFTEEHRWVIHLRRAAAGSVASWLARNLSLSSDSTSPQQWGWNISAPLICLPAESPDSSANYQAPCNTERRPTLRIQNIYICALLLVCPSLVTHLNVNWEDHSRECWVILRSLVLLLISYTEQARNCHCVCDFYGHSSITVHQHRSQTSPGKKPAIQGGTHVPRFPIKPAVYLRSLSDNWPCLLLCFKCYFLVLLILFIVALVLFIDRACKNFGYSILALDHFCLIGFLIFCLFILAVLLILALASAFCFMHCFN